MRQSDVLVTPYCRTMGYFGLGLSMTQLGGNIFIEFILGAAVEAGGLRVLGHLLRLFLDPRILALCSSH